MQSTGNVVTSLRTAAISRFIVLVAVALGDGSEIRHKCDGSRGELVCKVIAEGHLSGGGATELFLPCGDVAVF